MLLSLSFPLASRLKVTDPLDLLSKLLASTPTAVKVTEIQTTKANFATSSVNDLKSEGKNASASGSEREEIAGTM